MSKSCGTPTRGGDKKSKQTAFHSARKVPASGINRKSDLDKGMGGKVKK
jgi:hypothetical protein